MAIIFISHSSQDRAFARQLAEDLRQLGHDPWLDEWEIRVGDSITQKVTEGIGRARYLAVVLTPHAIASHWVEKEWQAKYYEELHTGTPLILPLLLEDCDVPVFLRDKRYADFRSSYAPAFAQLALAIAPTLETLEPGAVQSIPNTSTTVAALITQVQNRAAQLSVSTAQVLEFAFSIEEKALTGFCRRELEGWPTSIILGEPNIPSYRTVPAYMSALRINTKFVGWGGDVANLWSHFEQNPKEFVPQKLFIQFPLSVIETKLGRGDRNAVLTTEHKAGELWPDKGYGNLTIYLYARGDSYDTVYESIRAEFTRQLFRLLPTVDSPS
jgi:hypothetical protein